LSKRKRKRKRRREKQGAQPNDQKPKKSENQVI
jgi:hypothetical protein